MNSRSLFIPLCCCFIILSVPACKSKADATQINQDRANKIVRSLEDYERDHGQFPEKLDVLTPEYLSEIPKTTTGQSFTYKYNQIDGYYICFYFEKGANCCYMLRKEWWDCSPGGIE